MTKLRTERLNSTTFVAVFQESMVVQYLQIPSFIINLLPVALCPCSVAYIMTFPVIPHFNGTVYNIQYDELLKCNQRDATSKNVIIVTALHVSGTSRQSSGAYGKL